MMLVLSCAAFFAACTGDNAQALLETAQFEERQLNRAHAKELYEEVIRRYPASPEAQTAKDRLAALSRD
jgi:TolA-binding protein